MADGNELETLRARVRELEEAAAHAVCGFCLAKVPKDPTAITAHMLSCVKHPVSALAREIQDPKARLGAAYDRVAAQSELLLRRSSRG